MAFDPASQVIVDQLETALSQIGVTITDAEEARQLVAVEPDEASPRLPVGAVRDLKVAGGDGLVAARLYRPLDAGDGPLPAMVYFHGGGWVFGGLDGHDDTCRRLANVIGCVVLSVDYRLAPEDPFPAAHDDAVAATHWLFDNAAEHGVDPARILVGGDSSGGNLAAAVAQALASGGDRRLVMQLLIYPVLDESMSLPSYSENATGYGLSARMMAWCWEQYAPGELRNDPRAAPLRHADLAGLPPAHIVIADRDPLRDEGLAYADRLRDAGVDVSCVTYEDTFHGFFGFGAVVPTARVAFAEAVARARAVLAQ